MLRYLALLVTGFVLSATLATTAEAKGADVHSALVRCAEVSVPAPLINCGSDPLTAGEIDARRNGDLEVEVTGALPDTSYDVVVLNFSSTLGVPVGTLTTNGTGRGELRRRNAFDLDQAGVAALILVRDNLAQFVTGFACSAELRASLVRCAEINLPTPINNCGADLLRAGAARIDDGDVAVDVHGVPNTSYEVVLLGLGPTGESPLGTLVTDRRGKGLLVKRGAFAATAVGAGIVTLRGNSSVQFVAGFQSIRRRPPEIARFEVGLVRCASVNQLAALPSCGADSLTRGLVTIDQDGGVKAEVLAALPAVQYEVMFVAFDAGTEVSIGTFTTNPAGNGHLHVRDFFASGVHGAGNVVVRRAGLDQFVTGFAVIR